MEAPKPYIAHLDLDCFFVSVERIANPELRGKPVIVGGTPTGRGVVASASYEARKFGVRSAMPTAQALRLCPQAIVVRGRIGSYADYSRRLYRMLLTVAPVVERASIDEMYMDFTGCERLYGNDLPGAMKTLRQRILDEFELPCTIALASNKLVAKIAANSVKPGGVIFVPHGTEAAFLAPFPAAALPGVGEKTAAVLERSGYRTVADIQASSAEALTRIGVHGGLWDESHGRGSSHVVAERRAKSISREETFGKDIAGAAELERLLFELVEDVCATLRTRSLLCRTVALKLRYASFETLIRRRTIPATNYDPDIFAAARALFRETYDGATPVRLVGAGVSNFEDAGPLSLFPDKRKGMLDAVDALRRKYGSNVLHVGGA